MRWGKWFGRAASAFTCPRGRGSGADFLSSPAANAPWVGGTRATRKPRLLWQKWGGSALRVAQRTSAAILLQPPPRTANPRSVDRSPGSVTAVVAYGPERVEQNSHTLPSMSRRPKALDW